LPRASPSAAAAVLSSIVIVGMNPDIQYDLDDLARLRELDHVHAACIAAFRMTGIEHATLDRYRRLAEKSVAQLFRHSSFGSRWASTSHDVNPRSAMAVTMIFLRNSSFMATWRSGDLKRHAEESSHRNSARKYEPTHTFA
jgi:hypothetical protein